MNEDLIFELMDLTNKIPCETQHSALMRMGMLIEKSLAKMEQEGIKITRESLHEYIKVSIQKYDKTDKAA